MENNYGVFIDKGAVAGHLQLMRWLIQPGAVSVPHLTLRYADSHLPAWMKELYDNTVLTNLNIESAGTFDVEGWSQGAVETAFLTSFSSELESLAYKPDFPDSIFHLSVYAGERSRLAYRALREMSKFQWGLSLQIPGAQVATFPDYWNRRGHLGNSVLFPEAQRSLHRLTGSRESIDQLHFELDDSARLEVLKTLCVELHEMSQSPRRAPAAVPELFEDAVPESTLLSRPVQGSLFSERALLGYRSDRAELKESGTHITPPEVASEMARCALGYLPTNDAIRFLDPALGGGILYAQVLRVAREQHRTIRSAVGVEMHPARAQRAQLKFGREGLQVLTGDFLTAQPDDLGDVQVKPQFNLLVANPPYLRPDIDVSADRSNIRQRLSLRLGVQLRPSANAYVYFVLASIPWLREGAVSAWLLPRDALFGTSSLAMREYLARGETILRIHEYSDRNRFQSTRVSQVLLVVTHAPPPTDHRVMWTSGEFDNTDANARLVLQSDMALSPRWHLPMDNRYKSKGVRVGDLFEVRRGIASGANRAFILEDDDWVAIGSHAKELLTPILPKSRFIPTEVIESDKQGYPKLERRLWLIDSALPLTRIRALSPWLGSKLDDIQAEYGSRALLMRRHPFYRQEQQAPPPFVCIAMARASGQQASRRFLLNMSSARVLNNYHAMYLKPSFEEHCRANGVSAMVVLQELEKIPQSAYLEAGRWYHSGLVKLEPGDLRQMRVEGLLASLAASYLRGL